MDSIFSMRICSIQRCILVLSTYWALENCLNLKLMIGESHFEYHHILVHVLDYSCSKISKIESDNTELQQEVYLIK